MKMCLLKEIGFTHKKTIRKDVFNGDSEQNQEDSTVTRTDMGLE